MVSRDEGHRQQKNPSRGRALALIVGTACVLVWAGCQPAVGQSVPDEQPPTVVTAADFPDAPAVGERVERTPDEWRALLPPDRFRILREAGTERAFSGAYARSHDEGVFRCAGCGAPLYDANDKFDSGTGWPSFTQPIEEGRVTEHEDTSHGMRRVEILCASCDGHLGHVFPDGPPPTGQRHCVNSLSLVLEPSAEGGE